MSTMNIKLSFLIVLLLCMLRYTNSTSQNTYPQYTYIEGLSVPSEIALFVGDSINIMAEYDYSGSDIIWNSSNGAVVSVKGGVILAHKKGKAKITATYNQYVVAINVIVSNKILNVSPNKALMLLNAGSLSLSPSNFEFDLSNNISWISGNNSILKVDPDGVVLPVGVGKSYVLVTYNNFEECDTAFIEVIDGNSPLFSVSPRELNLQVGQKAMIHINSYVQGNSKAQRIWSVDNPEIATVNQLGFVFGVGIGQTKVNVMVNGQSLSVPVTIFDNPKETFILPGYGELVQGDSMLFKLAVKENGFTKEINKDSIYKWVVSDESLATISNDGVLRAKDIGRITVSAFYKNGFSSSTLVIKSNKGIAQISPDPIKIEVGTKVKLKLNNYLSTSFNSEIFWRSNDETVAIVDENGNVLGINNGNTMIQVYEIMQGSTVSDAKFLDDVLVSVSKNATAEINSVPVYEHALNVGEWINFSDAFPELLNTSRMEISTGNTVQIDKLFNINAVSSGLATIKCFSVRGVLDAVCKLHVVNNVNWKPGVKKMELRDLKTVVIEFNTDLFVSLDDDLKNIILVEVVIKNTAEKSGTIIDVSSAYFEDGTRTLVVILSRDIDIFNGEALRVYSESGLIAMEQNLDFEVFIGDANNATAVNSSTFEGLKVYPNPVSEALNIVSVKPLAKIEVFSQQGALKYTNEAVHALNNEIKLSGLTAGLYFVRVEDENGDAKTIKVFKQ